MRPASLALVSAIAVVGCARGNSGAEGDAPSGERQATLASQVGPRATGVGAAHVGPAVVDPSAGDPSAGDPSAGDQRLAPSGGDRGSAALSGPEGSPATVNREVGSPAGDRRPAHEAARGVPLVQIDLTEPVQSAAADDVLGDEPMDDGLGSNDPMDDDEAVPVYDRAGGARVGAGDKSGAGRQPASTSDSAVSDDSTAGRTRDP
jgi:hypothetical protein